MSEDNPPRKKRFGLLKRSRSNPHLAEERGRRAASDPSSLPPSRNGSRRGFSKFLGKVTERLARSPRQSPNPEPTAASSSAQDLPHPHTSQDLPPLATITPEPNPDQSSDLRIAKSENPDPKVVTATLAIAKADFEGIRQVSGIVENTASSSNNLQAVPNMIDTSSKILGPLKTFNSVATGLADVHPYAKVALSIFTCASKMILDQVNRDAAVSSLLSKISDVYALLTERDGLARIASMLEIYEKIARQTLECADFVVHYSDMKSFWRRLGKHVFNETEAAIQRHNEVLDNLMQQFRDQMALTTIETVHRIAEDLDVSGMEYVPGAGRNTSKNCLLGTREDILSEIKCWIRSMGEDVPRVLWLSGTAGKGKSAIAHTIANWSYERGGMRACFCFDRTREAERRHEKIFTTIARDLADCDIIMRGALARAVHDDNEVKHTVDISRQWQELVVGPIGEASKAITAPVLIVIDALDESGDTKSREQILRLLSGNSNTSSPPLSPLPSNFRIIVTSRPLEDIHNTLHAAPHIRHVSLDDVSPVSTELDIQLYISHKLEDLRHVFNDAHFKALALKSDGLFEWARLTCEYIKGTNRVGMEPKGRFNAVVAGTSAKGTRLLDDMYKRVLADIMPEDEREEGIPIFRSVMGQILVSLEPLPMLALTAMRLHFPEGTCDYRMDRVIGPLGSLLTGTSDSHTPIRPLHASFYDFLTNESRSHDFFVDASSVQNDLAFASLRVMEDGLRFNICCLESSYLPNSSVPELEKRVEDSISIELSYSCRFWGTHVAAMPFKSSLAKEVEAFFDGEHLLWWLEALALMKSLGGSVATLSSIANWFLGHTEFTHVRDATRDTLRFVRTFATTILCSTPHLYLSALPFAPTQSRIFRKFAAKFPRTPRIVAGHVVNWPQMEKMIHTDDVVYSVAMSPDGKRTACGLFDGNIQVWDTDTSEALYTSLQGHSRCVMSITFSLDGHRIVSGSHDSMVRVWDAKTGEALGSPLQGHTGYVWSVAISPDGKRIVSGSEDKTIRVWDIETGEVFGTPLQGHTGAVWSVTISRDGKRIVSGSADRTIRVWDMKTGETLGTPLQGHVGNVFSVAISPDDKHIVSGSSDKTIRVWDMKTGKAFGAPLKGHTASVMSVAISDENRIVSGSSDWTIRVWDVKSGKAVGSPLQGHTNDVWSIAISPDGSRIVSCSQDKTIRVWDADTIMGEASVAALQSHSASVNSVAISPDGCSIVSGSDDTTVQVWDIETGKALVAPLQGHTQPVMSVAISPDGKGIVSGSVDKSIRIWNMETGEASGVSLQGHTYYVRSVAILPDRNCIVFGSADKTIRMWDIDTGEVHPLSRHSDWVRSVAISSDGNHIVSGSHDKTIQVWDMKSGKASSAPLRGHTSYVLSVAISPDACRIVSGSRDTTIRVWDMGTGELLGTPLQGHTASVTTVVISDSNRIISGSSDQTVRVWDMKTGEAVCAPFRGHTGPVLSVAISPDGKRIVSGSSDKTIRVWDLEFLNWHQPFEVPAICFSSTLTHALHSASSFLHDSETPGPLGPNEDGWIVGPAGRLLLWIPLALYSGTMHSPGTRLVIPNNALQLDLSRVAHGTSWHKCREQ